MDDEEIESDQEPTTFTRSEITKTITRPNNHKRNLPIIESPQSNSNGVPKVSPTTAQPIHLPSVQQTTNSKNSQNNSIERLRIEESTSSDGSDSIQTNTVRLDDRNNMASSSIATPTNPMATTPKNETGPTRTRQHTMTVLSTAAQEVKQAFTLSKNGDQLNSDELERRLLALVTKMEKESLAKLDKTRKEAAKEISRYKDQFEADRKALELNTQELHRQLENLAHKMPNMAHMTASTLMSPDDTRTLKKERDQLEMELKAVHDAYRNMFNMYDKLKNLNRDLKEDNDHLREMEGVLKEQISKGQEKYMKMVEQAKERLNQANECIASLEKKSEDDTITLRAKLKRTELQFNATLQQLEIKKKECQELNEICQALIAKAEVYSDSEG